jgi:hypothetical protein
MRGNIESLIWERDFSHIAVRGADLDEVLRVEQYPKSTYVEVLNAPVSEGEYDEEYLKGKNINVIGEKVALTDLIRDPRQFGVMMIDLAKSNTGSLEQHMDALFGIYCDVGRQVLLTPPQEREMLFNAMAESILAMESTAREELIARRLYADMDRRALYGLEEDATEHLPNELHELFSARFSKSWTVPQVSKLLVKSSSSKPSFQPTMSEIQFQPENLAEIVREMSEYAPDELARLKTIDDFGKESDILEATVRTLVSLLSFVQKPLVPAPQDKTVSTFSEILSQLEGLQALLLEKKEYVLASVVLRSFKIPADPEFRPRLREAITRSGKRKTLERLVNDIRFFRADSSEYQAVFSYLSILDREATPALLEMLAEQEHHPARNLLIRILKDLGKDQIAMLGERLSDERWYFVRNIVSILGGGD